MLESVKLINFTEEVFNLEVGKMTDVMAERENAFYEGERKGQRKGKRIGLEIGQKVGIEKSFKIFESLGVSRSILKKARAVAGSLK